MECRDLEIFVHSATDLKELNLIGKMDPYVSVSLSGDPDSEQKTEVDTDGGKKPKWKGELMKFVINEDLAKNSDLTLVFKIMAEKPFGDKEVGDVYVPVKELLEDESAEKAEKSVAYGVKAPSGKSKGTLNFSYKLGEKFTVRNSAAAENVHEPVLAYSPTTPAESGFIAPGPHPGPDPYPYQPAPPQYGPGPYPCHPAPQQYGPGPYPYQAGYGYPPPQQVYGYPGAPPPAPYGYPGHPPPPGYSGYPEAQQHQESKSNMGTVGAVGLGVGAGLLGGLLIADMVSDAGDEAADDDDGLDF